MIYLALLQCKAARTWQLLDQTPSEWAVVCSLDRILNNLRNGTFLDFIIDRRDSELVSTNLNEMILSH